MNFSSKSMITRFLFSTSLFISFHSTVFAETQYPKTDHASYALDEKIWQTPLAEFKKAQAEMRFQWQTNEKKSLRSPLSFTVLGFKTGETIVTGKKGTISRLKFSVYNRGDHRPISAKALDQRFDQLKTALDKVTKKPHRDVTKRKSAVPITSYMWKTDSSAFLLEKSTNQGRGEFLRLKMAPLKAANSGHRTSSRSSLKHNLKKEANGDVYISNIPMVDQGAKGYCACASSARIYQYYGREVSMHEIAQMAGSDSGGTNPVKMVSAFKKAAGKLNSRVLVFYEYPKYTTKPFQKMSTSQYKSVYRETASDINKYQALAKKKGGRLLIIDGKAGGRAKSGHFYDIYSAQTQMDPEIYKEVMMKKSSYKRFMSNIKRYIDEGVPVGWALQLGMFKEPNLPQIGGGHMRLIIGYNLKKDTIIYSDSWGAGHAKKSMPTGNAFSMTNVLLALPPTG